MEKRNNIPFKKLAQYRHTQFLISIEKQALLAYNYTTLKLIKEIKKLFKKEKLAKSDDENSLHQGWSEEVPKLEIDVDELLMPIIDKHLEAIRWALLGKYAGKSAEKAAEEVGLKGKITPGIIPAAYLQSIDSHRTHYIDLFGKTAPDLSKELVKESLSTIVKRAQRFLDQLLIEYKNKVITAAEGTINEVTFENYNNALIEAQNLAPEKGAEEAVAEAAEGITPEVERKALEKELERIMEAFESRFETVARAQAAQASAVATHQAMLEIYGPEAEEVRCVNMEMEDERVCSFCKKISKNEKGWIYYKLTDLQPSGYNFSRKREDWRISIAPQHHRCRCQTIYVPSGFYLGKDGSVIPK